MNLFRSEEHVKNWRGYKPGTEEGIVELAVLMELFSADTFTRRLDPNYVSKMKDYRFARIDAWTKIMKGKPFWLPKTP